MVFTKLLADTLWCVQQLRAVGGSGPASLVELAPTLAAAAAELEACCRAVPDYRAAVGPRDGLCARLRAAEARVAALSAELELAVVEGECRAADAARELRAAAEAGWGGALTVEDAEGGAPLGAAEMEAEG